MLVPDCCVKKVWRPWHREVELMQGKAVSPNWGNEAQNMWRPKGLEFARQSTREEYFTERLLQTFSKGSPKAFSWVLISTNLWRNCPRSGKEPLERIRGNSDWHSYRAGSSPSYHQPDWKSFWFTEHCLTYREGCCLNRGIISYELSTCPVRSNKSW